MYKKKNKKKYRSSKEKAKDNSIRPLNKGEKIKSRYSVYVIVKFLDKGNSFYSYEVLDERNTRLILKEYIPRSEREICRRDNDGKIVFIDGSDDHRLQKDCEKKYNDFIRIRDFLNNRNIPILDNVTMFDYGVTSYLRYVWQDGVVFSEWIKMPEHTIDQYLKVLIYIAEALKAFENEGFYFTDIKPENIMLISSTSDKPKIIDIDSFWKSGHEIKLSFPYVPFEVDWNCDLNKREAIISAEASHLDKKRWHIFGIGMMLFRWVFNKEFGFESSEQGWDLWTKIRSILNDNDINKSLKGKIMKATMWQSDFAKIISDIILISMGKNATNEIDAIIEMLEKALEEYRFPKKRYAVKAFMMADEYPVFRFLKKNDVDGNFDITIIGDHPAREIFFTAYMASVQHVVRSVTSLSKDPNDYNYEISVPTFRLISDDAKLFLNQYIEKNPEMRFALSVNYDDGTKWDHQIDPVLTNVPYANIHVYNCSVDALPEDIAKSRYFIVLNSKEELNDRIIKQIINGRENDNIFIGIVESKKKASDFRLSAIKNDGPTILHMVETPYVSADEDRALNRMMDKGLQIHLFYCRGLYGRGEYSDFKYQFENTETDYNFLSSIRAAASILYKLWGLEIAFGGEGCMTSWKENSPEDELYKHIFKESNHFQNAWFIELTNIEHRSFCVWVAGNGYMRPSTYIQKNNLNVSESELIMYIFDKTRKFISKELLIHTCLVDSNRGYMFSEDVFNHFSQIKEECRYLEEYRGSDEFGSMIGAYIDAVDVALKGYNEPFDNWIKKYWDTASDAIGMSSEILNSVNPSIKDINSLLSKVTDIDPLDLTSINNRWVVKVEGADKNRGNIGSYCEIITREKKEINDKALMETLAGFLYYVDEVLGKNGEPGVNSNYEIWKEIEWDEKEGKLKNYSIESFSFRGKSFERIEESIKQINELLKPQLEYNTMHDFKKSDAAIIDALMMIVTGIRNIVLHRPLIGDVHDVVMGTVTLEPDYLDLFDPNDIDEEYDGIIADKQQSVETIQKFGREPKTYYLTKPQDISSEQYDDFTRTIRNQDDLIHVIDTSWINDYLFTHSLIEMIKVKITDLEGKEPTIWVMDVEEKRIRTKKNHKLPSYPISFGLTDMRVIYNVDNVIINKSDAKEVITQSNDDEIRIASTLIFENGQLKKKIRSVLEGLKNIEELYNYTPRADRNELKLEPKEPFNRFIYRELRKKHIQTKDITENALLRRNNVEITADFAVTHENKLYLIFNCVEGFNELNVKRLGDIKAIVECFGGNATAVIVSPYNIYIDSSGSEVADLENKCREYLYYYKDHRKEVFKLIQEADKFGERFLDIIKG